MKDVGEVLAIGNQRRMGEGNGHLRAEDISSALSAANLEIGPGWQPIDEGKPYALERVLVSGWSRPRRTVAGYWWTHEDVLNEDGCPLGHPKATYFKPLDMFKGPILPPEGGE